MYNFRYHDAEIDGIEALKRIRDSGDMTPVIMLTAKSEVEDRIMGLDAGADDYLAKPFAMGELLARIRSMTRRIGEFTPTKLKKAMSSWMWRSKNFPAPVPSACRARKRSSFLTL